jgi:two-component system nitrate/nitrite response regulator NarL
MSATSADLGITASDTTRVVVIDDHYDRRKVMSYVVAHGGQDIAVVGYADGSTGAVEAVERLGANVALLEIQLPTAEGLDTISALRHGNPELRIVVCSFHNDLATREAALARGADAYLTKPISPRDLYLVLRPPALWRSELSELVEP